MDVDTTEASCSSSSQYDLLSLSSQLSLEELWLILSRCLVELDETPDTLDILVLQVGHGGGVRTA